MGLPDVDEQKRWEMERLAKSREKGRRFHDIPWDDGETFEWLDGLFKMAGLGTLKGEGRIPPVLGHEVVWAIEHLKKYPEPKRAAGSRNESEEGWVLVEGRKDSLGFI